MGIIVNTKGNEGVWVDVFFWIPWLCVHQSRCVTRVLLSVSRSKEEWKSRSEYGKWNGYGGL